MTARSPNSEWTSQWGATGPRYTTRTWPRGGCGASSSSGDVDILSIVVAGEPNSIRERPKTRTKRWNHERAPPVGKGVPVRGGPMDTDWMADGLCRSCPPSVFFPSDGVGVEVARRICADCPVRAPCLEYALRNGVDHGVWGGASERERRRIARQRRLQSASAG
jgi:WhiB family redox-sensing transcriptional regulator